MEEATTQFSREGQPAFPANTGEDTTPSGSSPDNQEAGSTQTQTEDNQNGAGQQKTKDNESDAGFADHSRWKERENDWKKRFNEQETRHTQELQQAREDFEKKMTELVQSIAPKPNENANEPVIVPEWFNGDEASWRAYSEHESARIRAEAQKIVDERFGKIEQQKQQQQKAVEEATTYMNTEVTAIEADKDLNPSGKPIDRNALFKICHDEQLIDTQGRWNYRAAMKIMNAQNATAKKTTTEDRKALAGATTDRGGNVPATPHVASNETFQRERPW